MSGPSLEDTDIENRSLTSIRGVAALWVVGLHITSGSVSASRFLDYGYTAVDLFFILSGLILASVYSTMPPAHAGGFWLKRACRIYPAHIVALVILTAIVLMAPRMPTLWVAVANLPFVGSMMLLQPYIHLQAAANPVAWSVGIELGCYLLFPVAIVIVRGLHPLRGAAFCLAILTLVEWEVCRRFQSGTHGIPAIARGVAGFGLGMVLWRVACGLNLSRAWASIAEVAAVAGLGASLMLARPDLIPLWSAVLLFGLSYDVGFIATALRSETFYWLGSISYSVYLLHYPMALLVEMWLPIRPHLTQEEPLRIAAIVVATLVAATLSYRLIERPGRRIPSLLRVRRQTIVTQTV